jgi:predicted DNA-binding protein (UPF0251 family)
MRLNNVIKFQKTLALAASASNSFEVEAAEFAARRLMEVCNLDPTDIPNVSLYSQSNFADNTLLRKLREEWREAHPVPVAAVAVEPTSYTELEGLTAIPFSLSGFNKQAKKGKGKHRKEPVKLSDAEAEQIRLLFNEGLARKEVAELTGFSRDTVNSAKAYRLRKRIWLRDVDGKFQWAEPVSNPCVTQPTGDSPR